MKIFLLFILIVFISGSYVSCIPAKNFGKPDYVVVSDSETKVLKGILSRRVIENDTAFGWFKENMQYGQVDPDALLQFKQKADLFSLVVFGGTWCHDTQNLLPKFYRLIDKSGFPENKVSLIGVDREKKAPHDLQITWKITNVPTFIVLKNGKEVGRVVEYGKTGNIEKELGEIVAQL